MRCGHGRGIGPESQHLSPPRRRAQDWRCDSVDRPSRTGSPRCGRLLEIAMKDDCTMPHDVTRDGPLLVMAAGARTPGRCVTCNEPVREEPIGVRVMWYKGFNGRSGHPVDML